MCGIAEIRCKNLALTRASVNELLRRLLVALVWFCLVSTASSDEPIDYAMSHVTGSMGGDILCTVDRKPDISRARDDARSLFQRDWCPSYRDLLTEMMRIESTSASTKFGKRFNVSNLSSKQTASMFKHKDLDKDWIRLYKKHPRLLGLCDPYVSICDKDRSRILIRLDVRRGSLSGGTYVVALKKTGKTWTVVDSCATSKA